MSANRKGECEMSRKTIVVVSLAALVLMVAGISIAAPMWGGGPGRGGMGHGIQALQLTDSQQADWKALQEKSFQLKKERIQLMVKTGYMTKEQADAKLKMMESSQAFRMKNNLVSPGARLTPPLTEDQKADLKKMAELRLSLQKENLSRLVSAGQITQAQADAKIQAMQERMNARLEGSENGGPGRGGMGGPGMGGPRF